ncbi:MAG: hypothetical protein ACLRWQ_01490 [Flavonifractor plautii]
MFQNDYRREMDGLRPSPAAVERLNRLLEEGARPGGPGGWAAGRPRPSAPVRRPRASPPWRRAPPCGTRWRPAWGPTPPLPQRWRGKRPARASAGAGEGGQRRLYRPGDYTHRRDGRPAQRVTPTFLDG